MLPTLTKLGLSVDNDDCFNFISSMVLFMTGHGRRIKFKNVEDKNIVLEAFVTRKEESLLQPV